MGRRYTAALKFAWDPKKAVANTRKHSVNFREAATVFSDPLSTTFPAEEHSGAERRFITIGMSARGGILVVVHSDHNDVTRIISARKATATERKYYEEN